MSNGQAKVLDMDALRGYNVTTLGATKEQEA